MAGRSLWVIGEFPWNGEFGTNTIAPDYSYAWRSSPVSVVGGFTDWVDVVSGRYHTHGLRENGTIWGWGRNNDGEIGDGTQVNKSSPVLVAGGFVDWVQVTAGPFVAGGRREDGTLWTWGRNADGQLGDGTVERRSSPVSIVGGFTDWVHISCGYIGGGIRSNGEIWMWGGGFSMGLGDGDTIRKSSPVSILGGFTDWTDLVNGYNSTLAIRQNGSAWGWGENWAGQLGDGTVERRSSPVSIVGGFSDWIAIDIATSSGHPFSAGIRGGEGLYAWGSNMNWIFGVDQATIDYRSSPASVVNGSGFNDWIGVEASAIHTNTLRPTGQWFQSGLGNGGYTFGDQPEPTEIPSGYSDWVRIGSGYWNTFAIRGDSLPEDFGGTRRGRVPLIADPVFKRIRELPENDNLNLEGCNIVNAHLINGREVSMFSDETLKEDISDIRDPLQKIRGLRGVSFEWNDVNHSTHKSDIGLIAQEVRKIIPEVVKENKDGILSISYDHLIPVLIEAIKEQEKKIDELLSILDGDNNDS